LNREVVICCAGVAIAVQTGCGDDAVWPFYWGDAAGDVSGDTPGALESDVSQEDSLDSSPDPDEPDVSPDSPVSDSRPDGPEPNGSDQDSDSDGVADLHDPSPNDNLLCGDEDGDGCDDCTIRRSFAPEDDGFDANGDGICELTVDPNCIHGEHAEDDPLRREACELHALVNDDRLFWEEEGGNAPALRWDEDIWVAALGHSRDMCDRDFFEHDNPDGLSAGDRMRAAGVSMSGWGENISLYPTPLTIEYAFMAEPTCTGHRANILTAGFGRAASALYQCDNSSSEWFGYPFTTQNFVTDGGLGTSPYCANPATACEDVPDPVSTSRKWCRAEGSRCQDVDGPAQWDCPID
jgi:hypothetical protein